ncbi:MAG: amidase [Alphaproteobacteria bacterium]|nr:amidase [Alphaproteobacteria bacterium]
MKRSMGAVEAAKAIEGGSLTAEAYIRGLLDIVAERDGPVQAFIHLDAEATLAAARTLDKGPRRGMLHGVPVGVKDIIDTHDMPTGYGSPIYDGHRPAADAACVAGLRRRGGLVFGKTVSTEFAYYTPGKTRNPHDPSRTPGGSSSGSAAAVGAGMVPLAFGTQTAGSIIRPASFCGVVGYKPSFGTINTAGVKPFGMSLDTIGGFAGSVADIAFLVGALSGHDFLSGLDKPAAPRIGLCRTPQWPDVEAGTEAAFAEAETRLAKGLAPITLPAIFDDLAVEQVSVMAYEAAAAYASENLYHADRLSDHIRDLLAKGDTVDGVAYRAILGKAARARMALAEAMDGLDVLLVPAAPGEAPVGMATGNSVFNRMWTLLGVPCVTVPGLTGPAGLPVGLQLIGRPGEDARTLAAAAWLEAQLRG